jgi:hypothetical protein
VVGGVDIDPRLNCAARSPEIIGTFRVETVSGLRTTPVAKYFNQINPDTA